MVKNNLVGLGCHRAQHYFYIKNRPPLSYYEDLNVIKVMSVGDIAHIGQETGNHWRKIFNVYAKLMFELAPEDFTSWQSLRDGQLLQKSNHCLLFSPPQIPTDDADKIHIVLGKGYAEQLGLADQCTWLSHDFAVNFEQKTIISPYFDYRQLSNIKIVQLCRLIQQLSAQNFA
jgi:hypothetical protein